MDDTYEKTNNEQKIVLEYLLVTFSFSYILWNILIILNKFLKLELNNIICTVLYLAGSFGPLLESYWVNKNIIELKVLNYFLEIVLILKQIIFPIY